MSEAFDKSPPVYASLSATPSSLSHSKNPSTYSSLLLQPYPSAATSSLSHMNSLPSTSKASTPMENGIFH